MTEEIRPRDFVYCDTCEKGFIGEKTFGFVRSDHAGHRFRVVVRQKIEVQNENDKPAKDGILNDKRQEDCPF